MSHEAEQPRGAEYRRIVRALDEGRTAYARARFTAGALRFLGVAFAVIAGLILWAALQRVFRFYSVPVATAASLLGAGVLVFALVRWVVIPMIRLPGREHFVRLVEARFPQEKNLIVNAFQLGDPGGRAGTAGSRDLIDVLIARAAQRVGELDLRRWQASPDRPYLWAGASALLAVAALGILSPALLRGAVGQVVRPTLAAPPPVTLEVRPGDLEVDRGADVEVSVQVTGTGKAPSLRFRERNGEWRMREFAAAGPGAVSREAGSWTTVLDRVDRNLEYQVAAPRAESGIYAIRVKEPPRIAGYRIHLRYPPYTGIPEETVEGGAGDLAAVKGTEADLRVLTNRPVPRGRIEWRADTGDSTEIRPLAQIDETTWGAPWTLLESGSYAVVLTDETGAELVRSPRYRVEPAPDRAPFLTLHLPQEDHDLYDDMMERVVADAADDYGFSACRILFRVDDGPEQSTAFQPFTARQKEFRLDTLWDLSSIGLLPGQTLSFFVEVRDNDAVSGSKAARSEVRRVRFPTVGEIYAEVAEDQKKEIESLSDVYEEQADLRERLEKMNDELKAGKELNWDLRQDVQSAVDRQAQVEQQVSEALERLNETLGKASDRAGMQQDLVEKMSQLNELLENLQNTEMDRALQQLSDALTQMNREQLRKALENYRANQDEMLRGLDRTIELLKQIRKEGQVEDVVRRTDEIAQLQEEIAKELEKMGLKPEPGDETKEGAPEDAPGEATEDTERGEPDDPAEGEKSEESAQAGEKEKEGESDKTERAETGERKDEASPEDSAENAGDPSAGADQAEAATTPEIEALKKEIEDLEKQLADARAEAEQRGENRGSQPSPAEEKALQELRDKLNEALEEARKAAEERAAQEGEMAENRQTPPDSGQQGRQKEGQQKQGQQKQGQQQDSQSEQQQGQQSEQQGGDSSEQQQSGSPSQDEKLKQLAQKEKELRERVEELKRQLEMLRKLNRDDQQLAQDLEEMEEGETTESLSQSLQQAQQSMQSGQGQKSSKYAFKARDEAKRLAQMAQQMQQQMAQRQEDDTTEQMEAIIRGLIDVSGAGESLVSAEGDERDLAARQFFLMERAQAWSESLLALARQTFAVQDQQTGKLGEAMSRMERATRLYEQGDLVNGRHEGRESVSDVNETLVQLMQSHQQMCGGKGGGDSMQQMLERMQGTSEAQQGLNEQTGEMARRAESQGRLNMSDEERTKWLAAQQEMIRRGLEEMRREFPESKNLLGDLDKVEEDMESVEQLLQQKDLNRELLERQQQILSRLLDAQRSIRQQEMSPERESRTGTLASRRSPPELPEELLRPDRTLEEDVLRGANDRYPSQYRRLVEEYFRALAKETQIP